MYLTKLVLNEHERRVYEYIADCEKMHRFIMSSFPMMDTSTARSDLNVLYKLSVSEKLICVYIQSNEKPNSSAQEYTNFIKSIDSIDIDRLKNKCVNGSVIKFSLFANPVVSVKHTNEDAKSHRVFIKDIDKRVEWLKKNIEKNGCSLLQVSEINTETVMGKKKSHLIKTIGSNWTGTVKIEDQEKFWNMFCLGIGHEKSYGFGMLQIWF
jgi:CRISPR-associated protein Cas6/Cse3/CasE subtype I-E